MANRHLLATFFLLGRVLSPLYSLAMRIRAGLYARGYLASTRLAVPVVSVGNLTMGGTGKTPMVIYLSRLLAGPWRPGIVSRGYGGKSSQPLNLVSDGAHIFCSPAEVGDEPVLLAQSLPGVPVVTSRQRTAGGAYLAERGLADILILDDGFQHLALRRELDLVLFSALAPVQAMRVFPGGWLREPLAALARADGFVLTGVEDESGEEDLAWRAWLQKDYPQTPVFTGRYEPIGLSCPGRGRVAIEALKGEALFAFCGIANPQSFRQTLARSFVVKGWQAFADHHPFSQADLTDLTKQAKALACTGLITTEKDFVKLKAMTTSLPIWVLAVELRMEPGFDHFVLERVGTPRPARQSHLDQIRASLISQRPGQS